VQDTVYDVFAAKLAVAVKALKPAPGLEPGATQGPLIDDAAVQKSKVTFAMPRPKEPKSSSAAIAILSAAASSSPPCSPT